MERKDIINAIEQLSQERGIAPATVTSRAVGNSRLYGRLLAGGDCTTQIAARLLTYIKTCRKEADAIPATVADEQDVA